MAQIEVRSVSKSYGKLKALDRIDLHVEEGEFFGFLGPNGAGKSTLLKILTGQLQQDSGEVSVLGVGNIDQVKLRSLVGIVPEAETPPSFLTSREFLELVCRIRGLPNVSEKVDHWIDFFDMESRSKVLCKDLSKGQRQKMMLAAAFIHQPRVLFLDEPFINLDPIYQRKLKGYLQEISDNGVTIFMCTHILEIAEKLCNRLAVIHNGRVIGLGTIGELKRDDVSDLETIFLDLLEEDGNE